ncbi:Aste57867_3419 [Aphanomyces stellatus]|uniref:Aste57867_3419 protein n=1 Tax=Aphanomyces stellatus TaxID=120398 RepID=A0A485KDI3_9STRA|nr:hypothetical protein As57867_003409 [Aphanomyces stellatus]VFT80585.1 Aste57867_3419 [Aphanomyces stellatus]
MKFAIQFVLAIAVTLSTAFNDTVVGIDGRIRTVAEDAVIQDDADTNRRCQQQNGNYLPILTPGKYAASAFHNCFHTTAQIYEFLDTLVGQNANILSKISVGQTTNGATIVGYKLSTASSRGQSLYFQSMIHAREWIAGSSNLFTLSSILDDVANNKPTPSDSFDLYFVPIVNVDGYDITWHTNRYQRKNVHEVDINRNFPSPYSNPNPPSPAADDFPGPYPFSEVEAKSLNDWLQSQRTAWQGFVDIHSYSGLILYPFGDTRAPIGNGVDAKFEALGRGLQRVMGAYTPEHFYELYMAYGTFTDYTYREFKKASITIEIIGQDFVAPAADIRTHGKVVYNGLIQFPAKLPCSMGERLPPLPP